MSFQQHGVFDIQLRDDLFLTDEGFDASVLQKTQAAVRLSRGLPVGMAEFTDVLVHVPSGIIIDTANACCWQGSLLNWTAPALMRNVARAFGGDANNTSFHLSDELLSDCKAIDSAVLITSAGYSVYGHWLIDYLPRINRVPDEVFQKHRALQLPQKTWAHSLARIFAPQCRFFGDDIDTAFVRVERLLVPTTARAHGALEEQTMRAAWKRLDDALKQDATSGKTDRRLFISRGKLEIDRQAKRSIINIADIERQAVMAGFEAIHPETLPFAEQRQLFSEAAVVLGEDGSGLHNAIFCKPGARLGVISTDRKNPLHAMIANTCGLHVTYISARAVEDEADGPDIYKADARDVDKMLGILLAGP